MMRFVISCLFVALMVLSVPALAQDTEALEQRMALAEKMHEIRPLTVQIEESIRALAQRYPEDKRELFIAKMLETFDQQSLTQISVQAMAETFTVPELEKMIEFYGSDDGKSAMQKMPVYQTLVEPEIIKKLDQALMEIRTGQTAR